MHKIKFSKIASKQIEKLFKNKQLLVKLEIILQNIETNPYSSSFKFEKLKYNYRNHCSKRLDKKNRVIYEIIDDEIIVLIISVLGHYDD